MFEKPDVLKIASALAGHAELRQVAIARNVANADTPGYRATDLPAFSDIYHAYDDLTLRTTRPQHADTSSGASPVGSSEWSRAGAMSPNENSVSLETEMMKAAEVKREHDMALAVFGKSLAILRASLGR